MGFSYTTIAGNGVKATALLLPGLQVPHLASIGIQVEWESLLLVGGCKNSSFLHVSTDTLAYGSGLVTTGSDENLEPPLGLL